MSKKTPNYLIPLAFVGMMFFAIGFALGINSYLIPVLEGSLGIASGKSYLIIAATFLPFIIFGYPASMVIKKIGYKKTMALSFLFFACAFALFIPSARLMSFELFLLASFVSGIGNTLLQASVNPYITILGPIESAAKRMSIMGICNKLAWPVAPIFLAWIIGKHMHETVLDDLFTPVCYKVGAFLFLGVLALLAPLPEVKAVGEDEDDATAAADCPYAVGKTSIWQFPHLVLGAITLFLYVGVETVAMGTLVDFAVSVGLPNPTSYAWISPVGMVIGYIFGILLIPKYMSQSMALKICSVLAIIGSVLVVTVPADMAIWFTAFMALGCSLMWPALWPLAMTDLGRFTKAGSSLLVMAIAGGAVIPTIFGLMKETMGPQNAYWICLPCFLMIFYYGMVGYKIRTKTVAK